MTIDDGNDKPDEKEQPVSIRDSLMDAIEEVGTDDVKEGLERPARKPVTKADEEGRDEMSEGIERDPRPRDEQGRFVKADGSVDEDAEAKRQPRARAEAEARHEEQAPPPREESREQRVARMTANWRAEQKQFLAQQSPEVQDFLIARDQEIGAAFTKKSQRIATLESEYGPIHQMLEPDIPALRAAGMTPRMLIEGWANAERALLAGPQSAASMMRNVAEGYQIPRDLIAYVFGFDPRTPQEIAAGVGQQQQQQQPGYYDPRVDVLLAERQHEQEQAALAQHNAQRAAANQAMAQIQEFRDATDRRGNLLHPYFAEVENHMVALADNYIKTIGKVPPLKQLYEDAVGANPETRARMLADVQATQSERARSQQAARGKTEQARRASLSVVGAGSGRPNNRTLENGQLPRGSSIRAHLDRAISEVGDAD